MVRGKPLRSVAILTLTLWVRAVPSDPVAMWNLDSFCKSITTDGFITELSCVVAKVLYFEYLTWSLCYTNQKLWQLLAWEQFIGSMLTTHYLELKTEYVEYWHLEAQSVVATWKYFQRLGCRSIAKWSNCNTVADCISLTVLKDLGRSKLHAVGHGYVKGTHSAQAEPPRPPAVYGKGKRSLTLTAPNGPKM